MKIPLLLSAALLASSAAAQEKVDYARDIKPIFAANCVSCHGPKKQKAGLRLDFAKGIHDGGNTGPALVPGKAKESLLLKAVTGDKSLQKMPPDEEPLNDKQLALIRRWIEEGAEYPKDEVVAEAISPAAKHWSFQPIKRSETPANIHAIDFFIQAELAKKNIKPSPEADKVTLIRRLSLDLTGLPPSIAELDAFVKDTRPEAYEHLVDRLLASPHYGERWGRHWLDQARYADSNGYSIDAARQIWKYRDWVIDALNKDMPFDRFTIEQLAGDLLPNATQEQQTATGFHRNTQINQEGGINVEQFRVESVVDRVNTTGSVWLGLTVGCCQCHDHKFDPISQREYYQFFAFFNNSDEPNLDIGAPGEVKANKATDTKLKAFDKQLKALDPSSQKAVLAWERKLTAEDKARLPATIQKLLEVPENGRTTKQHDNLEAFFRANDRMRNVAGALGSFNAVGSIAHATMLKTRFTLEADIAKLKKTLKPALTTMVVKERAAMRTTTIMLGGDFTRPGVKVNAGTPAVLPKLESKAPNRLDLAKWIVDPKNPLTARVLVNRVWGQYFGLGLVETENDFGTQGDKPTHPELLDWLADEFMRQKWSLKALHKWIVTSATYKLSSNSRPDLATVDARNKLLARQTRMRLEAEIVRDVCMTASGLLNPKVGGPSVYPPQPEGIYKFTQVDKNWKPSDAADRYRRGMYTYFWRSAPHPALMAFDAPDASTSCTRRNRSNTPLQALTLLNDTGFHEYAQGFAKALLAAKDDTETVNHAFRRCVSREPTQRERDRLVAFLASQIARFASNPKEAAELADKASKDPKREAALVMLARVLLNLDETITRE